MDASTCGSCKKARLIKAEMWEGTAWYWYCAECGWINRWRYKMED